VRYGVYVPTFGEYDVLTLAALANEAERVGWDGFFVWDHLFWAPQPGAPLTDTTVALTAITARCERESGERRDGNGQHDSSAERRHNNPSVRTARRTLNVHGATADEHVRAGRPRLLQLSRELWLSRAALPSVRRTPRR
jgi:hypothetical protein